MRGEAKDLLRILSVADVDPAEAIGGAERTLIAQSEELSRRGHGVTVLVRGGETDRPACETRDGYAVVRFPVPPGRGPAALQKTLQAARDAAQDELSRTPYDVLFLQQPLSGAGAIRAKAARGLPVVYNFLSPWSEEYRIRALERRCPLADPNTVRPTPTEAIQTALRRRLEGQAVRRADRVLLMSAFMADWCRRLHGADPTRFTFIPGGVDTQRFRPREDRAALRERLDVCPDTPMLFTVRNLVPRMGLGNLLEGLVLVLRAEPKAVCVIGGSGPLREALQQRARDLGLGERVRFAGFIPEAQLPDYYAAADLFVLPTAALEGFGLVTVEAMACGTPAVGTPVGGTPEILRELDPALVLPDATPAGIARGVLEALPRVWHSEAWRRRCRAFVEVRYAWKVVVDQVEQALRETARRGPRQ